MTNFPGSGLSTLPEVALATLERLVPVDDIGFYWIDAGGATFGHVARAMPRDHIDHYRRWVQPLDPLHHRHFSPSRETIVDLGDQRIPAASRGAYMAGFLAPRALAFEIELFLYDGARPICAFALLRGASSGLFTDEERQRVAALAPLLEHMLAVEGVPLALSLTRREAEVARLAALGLTNGQICESLKMSLSTVKTHLERIFDKSHSSTRAELASKMRRYAPSPPLSSPI